MASKRIQREGSMAFSDLERDHENRLTLLGVAAADSTPKMQGSVKFDEAQLKVKEHESIFEEIVQELEEEVDDPMFRKPKQRRGSLQSVTTVSSDSTAQSITVTEITKAPAARKPRRHSSFHASDRIFHRRRHDEMKTYFYDHGHEKRSSIIGSLFQFQLSVNMASFSSLEETDTKALYRSCPILTYMNDDDEDSVDLFHSKQSSLPHVMDEGEYMDGDGDFELSDDDYELTSSKRNKKASLNEGQPNIVRRSYTVKLAGLEDDNEKPRAKKRTTSYSMLVSRLDEHPLRILDDIRSASMSNIPTVTPSSFLSQSSASQKLSASKGLAQFKMSGHKGAFDSGIKDLMTSPPLALPEFPPEQPVGVGRAA